MKYKNGFFKYFDLITDEPYRVFFPLGLMLGIIGASHWLWYALGWTPAYSGFFHSSLQTLGYIHCFVIGFLMTSVPRFSSSNPPTRTELTVALLLTLAIAVGLFCAQWVIAEMAFLGHLAFLLFFVMRRFIKVKKNKDSLVAPPTEFVWIFIGVLHGVTGTVLMIGTQVWGWPMWLAVVGKPLMQIGFLLSVVIGVGGFLAPRLMGSFEPALGKMDIITMRRKRRHRITIHFLFAVLLFSSFWLEAKNLTMAFLVRAIVVTAELVFNRAWPHFPKVPDLFVKLLAVSVWMVVVGSWTLVLYPPVRIALMHFILIGGFSLMTFAVGTMVILSHGGEAQKVRKPLPVLWIVLVAILVSLSLRIAAVVNAKHYFHLLGWTAAVWMTGSLSWLCFIAPRILKAPISKEEFERCHEESKQRVNQLRQSI